ncbi:MAG: alpha-amylase family protein, partial [Phycisphaeraceae bacterium JB051]
SNFRLAKQFSMWHTVQTVPFGTPDVDEVNKRFNKQDAATVMNLVWPRPLKITAIRFTPVLAKPGKRWGGLYPPAERTAMNERGEGKLVLTQLSWDTVDSKDANFYSVISDRLRFGRNQPATLFVDDLIVAREKGDWDQPLRYQLQLFDGYAGKLLWQTDKTLAIDLRDPAALFANRIELPKVPTGRYFIKSIVWDSNQSVRDERTLQWWVAVSDVSNFTAINPSAVGMWWEDAQAAKTVDTQSTTLSLHLSQAYRQSIPDSARIRITINDYNKQELFTKVYKQQDKIDVTFQTQPGKDYFAIAQTRRGPQILDQRIIHIGHLGQSAMPDMGKFEKQSRPTRDEFLKNTVQLQPEYRVPTTFYDGYYPWYNHDDIDAYKKWLIQAKTFESPTICVKAGWSDVEVLPGVYRWENLDKQVMAVKDSGMKIMFAYTPYASSPCVPIWLQVQAQQDHRGDYKDRFSYRYSCMSPNYGPNRETFWHAVAKRYAHLPWVIGYRIYTPAITSGVDPHVRRMGYAPGMQQAYAKWLKARNLPVEPIAPVMNVDGVHINNMPADFSQSWQNTALFFSDCIIQSDISLAKAIREIDPTGLIQLDRKNEPWAIERIIPELAKMDIALKNEAAPVFRDAMLQSMCVQAGVPYLQELHRHVPTSRSISDATSYFSSYLSETNFWLLRWSTESFENPGNHPVHANFAKPHGYQYAVDSLDAWQAYMQGDSYEPQVLVFGSRLSNQIAGERRGYYHAIDGLLTYQAMVEQHQVPTHFADEHCSWVDLNKFKLILLCGMVHDEKTIEKLVSFAKQGGILALVADAATRLPDGSACDLRKQLAGMPNVVSLEAPHRMQLKRAELDWAWPFEHDHKQIDQLLKQAKVTRPAKVITDSDPAFQVQLRKTPDGKKIYVAVMRNWHGWYRNNIEFEEQLKAKWGLGTGKLLINAIPDGKWQVTQLLRDKRDLGVIDVKQGPLSIDLQPALGGQVQIFELTAK